MVLTRPCRTIDLSPCLVKNFKSSKLKTEIHPFCYMVYSKIDPAPNKLELDVIQKVFPNATIIISPQEVLNELCSVSFGLQSHVNRPDVLAALQKIMENQTIIPPVGISVANNRATKTKFSTIFFLGPTALFALLLILSPVYLLVTARLTLNLDGTN